MILTTVPYVIAKTSKTTMFYCMFFIYNIYILLSAIRVRGCLEFQISFLRESFEWNMDNYLTLYNAGITYVVLLCILLHVVYVEYAQTN